MDMDFLLKNIQFEKNNIINILKEILNQDIDDNITFDFINISNIREEDAYGGFRISLLGKFENIKVPVSIDIATGDPIMPSPITYQYKCLFDEKMLGFSAYNYETILAEKLQTIISRSTTNSRSKDFYDVYIIYKLRKDEINFNNLKLAFNNTCNHRNTYFSKNYSMETISTIVNDQNINIRWLSYARKNAFASKINFNEIAKILYNLINYIY